ncbi:MAG: DedA family protein [Nitrospirae bacterium]|nr:DedA family protein [Nitrospirota bacterium]
MELARQLVADYGYLAVFVGTFLEGEAVLLCAGFAAHQGLLSAPLVVLTAALGAYTGHIAFFFAGRWKGRAWLFGHRRLGRHARKADRIITRNGWTSVFVLQYLYGARIAGALAFGMSSFRLPRFLALQTVNCLVWAAVVTAAGYLVSQSLDAARGRLALISAAVVALLVAGAWVIARRR